MGSGGIVVAGGRGRAVWESVGIGSAVIHGDNGTDGGGIGPTSSAVMGWEGGAGNGGTTEEGT